MSLVRSHVAAAAVFLASAGPALAAELTYAETSMPTTLNPLFATSFVDLRAQALVFDRLMYRVPVAGELQSRLVARSEVSEGGLAVRLTLRDGIRWHDGASFGPDDVCFTVATLLDPVLASAVAEPYRRVLAGCESSPAQNLAVVRFQRVGHDPRVYLDFAVLPAHLPEVVDPAGAFSKRPVGTGPMRAVQGRRKVEFTAVPNAHHDAQIDQVVLVAPRNPLVAVRWLLSGRVDGIVQVPNQMRHNSSTLPGYTVRSYESRSWWFVAVNTHRGALRDPRIRAALDLTVDRAELLALTVGSGPAAAHSELVSGPFVRSSPSYNLGVRPRPTRDLAAARALMLEAGATEVEGRWVYDGAPIRLQIGMRFSLDADAKDLLNQLANQLEAGGFETIRLRLSSEDWRREAMTGQLTDFDLLIGTWSFGWHEDVSPLFHSRGPDRGRLNLFNYANPEVDRQLGQIAEAQSDTEARELSWDLHATLAEDRPYLFLWQLDTASVWRAGIENQGISPVDYFTEFDGWRDARDSPP